MVKGSAAPGPQPDGSRRVAFEQAGDGDGDGDGRGELDEGKGKGSEPLASR